MAKKISKGNQGNLLYGIVLLIVGILLAIGGISRTLMMPVKIVWFNQTRVLRFFTPVDDEILLTKYIETVIRRTFGTKDAMKLAKPVPDNEQ